MVVTARCGVHTETQMLFFSDSSRKRRGPTNSRNIINITVDCTHEFPREVFLPCKLPPHPKCDASKPSSYFITHWPLRFGTIPRRICIRFLVACGEQSLQILSHEEGMTRIPVPGFKISIGKKPKMQISSDF